MQLFLIYTVAGIVSGSIYAISAAGLVVTYITSRVFNFAHGAMGMLIAFLYYSLRVQMHWPEGLALAVSLLVIGPLLGIGLYYSIMHRLERAAIAIRLMVTLALFLFVTGFVTFAWSSQARSLPTLLPEKGINPLTNLHISYDELAIVGIAILVGFGMEIFFKRTRIGTTMRAVVDDRTLSEMNGVRASRVTALSWALGTSLAGLAAILIAPSLTLSIEGLSLLVVSSYAAAIVGRLTSLKYTFVGAIGLGLLVSYATGYLPQSNQLSQQIGPAVPFLVLFVALTVLRAEPGSRFERLATFRDSRPPSLQSSLKVGGLIIAAVAVASPFLSSFSSLIVAIGLAYACILLSLVLITGMSGQISLAQMSFAGLAAVLLPHLASHMPWAVAVIVCVIITAVAGTLVALPTLRLRGLYLALSTLAFAVMMDNIFFPDTHLINPLIGAVAVPPPSLFGLTLSTNRSQLWLLAVVMVGYMVGIFALRRRRFGHSLTALRDSPVAASTLGLNLTRTKLAVFALSAAMAGFAGCLYGSVIGLVSGSQFNYQTSMSALLILAIYGLGSVPGAIMGAIFYAVLFQLIPIWIHSTTVVEGLQPLLIAGGVLTLVMHPEGVMAHQAEKRRQKKIKRTRTELAGREHLDEISVLVGEVSESVG